MVEIKADESISGFAQAAQYRTAQRNPEPEPEVAPEPQAEPEVVEPEVAEQAPAVEETPVPVIEEPAQIESENLMNSLDPMAMDPEIVSEMLSDNAHRRHVNRLVYGDSQIADAMRRREEGTLQMRREPYKPLPYVQELMSASGENHTVIGYFLAAQNSPRAMVALEGRLGEARMDNLKGSMDVYEDSQKPKGLFATIGDDLGKFATKGDIIDAPVAGMAAFSEDMSGWFGANNWLTDFQKGIHNLPASDYGSTPSLSEVAEFLNITTQRVRVTPESQEDIDRLTDLLPDYSNNNKGMEQLEIGKTTNLSLNPEELQIYNDFFGTVGNQANRESMKATEEELMAKIDSGTGMFMAVATEYMSAYVLTPGFSKGTTFLGKAVNGLLKGAAADLSIYEEGDANISAWLSQSGVPGGDLLEFMATDPSDSEIMNKAKVIAEGSAIGVAFETLMFGLMSLNKARKGDMEGAMKDMAKSVDAEAESTAVKATEYVQSIEDLKAGASKQEQEIAAAAAGSPGKKVTKEIFQFDRDTLPDWNPADEKVLDALTASVRVGTASGVSATRMKVIFGKGWLGDAADVPDGQRGRMFEVPADEMADILQKKFLKMMEKLQEPTSMNTLRGMGLKVLAELDEDLVNPDLLDRVKNVDPSEWSTNDAANIFAAGFLQDQYIDAAQRLVADLRASADQMTNDVFEEKMKRLDNLQAQVAVLQAGTAKMGQSASHAFHALKRVKTVEKKLAAQQAHREWQYSRGLISDKQKIELLDAAFNNAKNKRAKAKVFNQVATKPTTMEKLLHVSNANLLFNTSTQALMLMGNFVRATIRNPMVNLIEAAVVNPIEGVLGRADWAKASGQSFKRFWHSYGAIAQSMPDAMTAFSKFWRRGKSQFGENSMFDDKGYYANKTLKEVRQSKAEGSLDHGMKAAEHVYRFMGSVDEMFKELVISSEMATHARAGTYGEELMKLAQKRKLTNADWEAFLLKQGEEAAFAKKSTDGRVMDNYAREVALDTMFQSDAAQGSLNQGIKKIMMGRTNQAMMMRLLFMRFVTTPLNVMEERMATVLAPILLIGKDNNVTRAMGGKFARDLQATLDDGAPDMRIRSRTRAILAANSIFTTMGIMSAYGMLKGDGDEGLIDVDPKSRTYGNIRIRMGNGKKKYINTLDMEVPFLNAFVFARMAAEHVKHAQDIEQATEYLDTVGAITAMYLNQTLEKSSLANMTDTLAVIMDDGFRGSGQVVASNLSTAVPFNWWFSQLADLTGGGEFQGKPVNFYERLGKSIGPLKLMGFGAINQERDALGRLQPSHSRGFNPFVSREFAVDALSDELADIQEQTGTDFMSPTFERDGMPYHKMKAQDGQSVYDFMQESISQGDVKINGMTLEQAANAMIEGDYYQTEHSKWRALLAERHVNSKSQPILKVGGASVKDPRVKLWRGLLSQYRDAALRYALTSVGPEIRKELEEVYQTTGWTDAEKRFVADQF